MNENPLDEELDRTDLRTSAAILLMGFLIFAAVIAVHALFGVQVAFPLLIASLLVAGVLWLVWMRRFLALQDLHDRFESGESR